MKRRRALHLLGAAFAGGCGAPGNEPAPSDAPECASASPNVSAGYCLVESVVVRVTNGAALSIGDAVLVGVDDLTAVIVARDEGGYYARSAVCTHACCVVLLCDDGACAMPVQTPPPCQPLAVAPRSMALCPCHGSLFRLADGAPTGGPATLPLPCYSVSLDAGDLLVDTALGVDPSVRLPALS